VMGTSTVSLKTSNCLWVILRLVSVRQSSSRSSLTEGKGTELLARARKVFCLQEKKCRSQESMELKAGVN